MKKKLTGLACLFAAGSLVTACAENENGNNNEAAPAEENETNNVNEANNEENEMNDADEADNDENDPENMNNDDNDNENAEADNNAEANEDDAEEDAESISLDSVGAQLEEEGDEEENEFGTFTLVNHAEVSEEVSDDLFTVQVDEVKVVETEMEADYEDEFMSEDPTLIFVHFNTEHTADDMAGIYPDYSSIEVDMGEEDAARGNAITHMADDVGGEFNDGETREGWVLYELQDVTAEEVETLTVMVDPPHDENHDTVSGDDEEEPLPMEIEITL